MQFKFWQKKENVVLFFLSLAVASNSVFMFAKGAGFLGDSKKIFTPLFIYFVILALVVGAIIQFGPRLNIQTLLPKILLSFLPTQIIFLFGFQSVKCTSSSIDCIFLNNIFPLMTAAYFILVAYALISRRNDFGAFQPKILSDFFKNQNKKIILVLLAVFFINLGFGAYHLGRSNHVDEALWTYNRIPGYWNNILDGEWHKTRISDKPGVTVAIISGIGMLFENPKDYESTRRKGESPGTKTIVDMNLALRLPILIFNALSLFIFYFLLKKLLGEIAAVLSAIFIGLSPILLGISTIINPDSLLWVFMPLSLLCYLLHMQEGQNSSLYWSGIFLGLALLTKYVANIFFVFFFFLIFAGYIFRLREIKDSASDYLKKSLTNYLILAALSLITFFTFLPAVWTDIGKLLDATIFSEAFEKVWLLFLGIVAVVSAEIYILKGRLSSFVLNLAFRWRRFLCILTYIAFLVLLFFALANPYLNMQWADFETILASPKSSGNFSGFSQILGADFYSLVFGIMPLALFFLLFSPVRNIFSKKTNNTENSTVLFFLFFIFAYYIASTLSGVSSTVRYQIIIYPLAFIIAAIGIKQFFDFEIIKKFARWNLIYFFLILFSIFNLYSIKPFYFSYASSLLPQKYVLNLKDMGDGSYEAAQYLNQLPNVKDMCIWTDKSGVCDFFLGKCSSTLDFKRYITENAHFDYYVASAGRQAKITRDVLSRKAMFPDYLIRFDKLYTFSEPDYEITIGRKSNFVKIINADKIDLSYDFRLDENYKK